MPPIGPAFGPRLEFRQSQTLVMTPQLRQAIKLLQFSHNEVNAFVEEELERNPMLERAEHVDAAGDGAATDGATGAGVADDAGPGQDDWAAARADDHALAPAGEDAATPEAANGGGDWPDEPVVPDSAASLDGGALPDAGAEPLDADWSGDFETGDSFAHGAGSGGRLDWSEDDRGVEDFAVAARSLRERLGEQLRLARLTHAERLIGAHLIALLEPSGRLGADPDAVAASLGTTTDAVEAVRARIMRFDPVGVCARSLAECLAVQLAERDRLDPAMHALIDHLELLGRREYRRLELICGVDADDLAAMIAEIRALDPKPGAGQDDAVPVTVIPDVLLRDGPGGTHVIELNPDTVPRVLVAESFHARVVVRAGKAERMFMAEKLASANWLVKSLQQRAQTILKVAGEIARRQDGFLRHGVSHLRPLILRDIAEAVELHESTVSRVTANKYIATPRGTFELKYFFTTAIPGTAGESHSAEAVRHRIRGMIDAEPAAAILSDDAIVARLRQEGVDIARRTVAKYREALRIPSSVQRKRERALTA